MRRIHHYTCILCLLFGFIHIAAAQSNRRTSVYSTVVFQTWKLSEKNEDRRLTQFALPLFITRPISSRLQLLISEANAVSTVDFLDSPGLPDDNLRLSGIGDTKVKLSYGLIPKKLLVTLGSGFSTGKNKLNTEEAQVLRQFSSETLGFSVGRLGEGLSANVGVAGIQPVGPFTFGIGGSYLAKGGYRSLDIEGTPSYNPGNQFSGLLGVDLKVRRFYFRTGLTLTTYTPDQYAEVEQFRQGSEAIIENLASYYGTRFSATVYLRNTTRNRNEFPNEDGELIEEINNHQGRGVVASLSANYRLSRRTTLRGAIENRRRLKNELDEGESAVLSFSGGMSTQLLKMFVLDLGLKFSQGDMRDGAVDLQGLTFSSTLISAF